MAGRQCSTDTLSLRSSICVGFKKKLSLALKNKWFGAVSFPKSDRLQFPINRDLVGWKSVVIDWNSFVWDIGWWFTLSEHK